MGNLKKYKKNGSNYIGKYCNDLVDDFFQFCDGHPEKVVTMVWMKDIESPMPPSPKQMGTLLSRLDVIWKKYCRDAKLPNETQFLFINRVKKEWMEHGKKQMGLLKKKREGEEQAPH